MSNNMQQMVQVQGTRRITEMASYPSSLTGLEEILIDSGDTTYKITVDSLLGYLVDRIQLSTLAANAVATASLDDTDIDVLKDDINDLKLRSKHGSHDIQYDYDFILTSGTTKISPINVYSEALCIVGLEGKEAVYIDPNTNIKSMDLMVQIQSDIYESYEEASDSIIRLSLLKVSETDGVTNIDIITQLEYDPKIKLSPVCSPMILCTLSTEEHLELQIETTSSGDSILATNDGNIYVRIHDINITYNS